MRKSINDLQHLIINKPYAAEWPKELEPYHVYLKDVGHCIVCILKCHLEEALKDGDLDEYELPVPALYVLEQGYTILHEYIVVDAEYSNDVGLIVDYDKYVRW